MSAWAATAFDRPPRGIPGLRERFAEREIHVGQEERCTLCGAIDPVGAGCCFSCLGRSGERLLFFRRPVSRAARDQQIDVVRSLLPPEIHEMEVGLVADGHRALAAVPTVALERVEAALTRRGLSVRCGSPRWSLAPTPAPLLLVLVLIAATGALGVGLSTPWPGVVAPGFALLLWALAQYQLRRPALDDPERGGWLGSADEAEVVRTLISLRSGRARLRFSELVRLGRLLHARAEMAGDRETAEDVATLLAVGADVASDLDEVLVARGELEGSELFGRTGEERAHLRDTAERLEGLLIRAAGVLGRSHRRFVNDGACSGELSFLIHEIDRGRARYTKALEEVNDLLESSGTRPETSESHPLSDPLRGRG